MKERRARGEGRIYQKKGSANWWVRYSYRGERFDESSGSPKRGDAVKLLQRRFGEMTAGRFIGPEAERLDFEDLAEMLLADYRVNGRKSLERAENSVKRLRAYFGRSLALDITPSRAKLYIASRQEQGAAASTIRNELVALGRMFTLAVQDDRLAVRPRFPSIQVRNTREGFFEEEELRAVLHELSDDLRPVVLFAYLTGWRISEVLTLEWKDVDFRARELRLEPGTTKNDEGRGFPFRDYPPLAELLDRQRARTETLGRIVRPVFHRGGEPIRNFRKAWAGACERARVPARRVHDLRRSAVRNLERAGVPRSWAMKLTGHKTEGVYRRYAITSKRDTSEAVRMLAAAGVGAQLGGERGNG